MVSLFPLNVMPEGAAFHTVQKCVVISILGKGLTWIHSTVSVVKTLDYGF